MFDYNERRVFYQKKYGDDANGNIISYPYIPKFTEYHMIKPVQVNNVKKKNVCGYIIMFKKSKIVFCMLVDNLTRGLINPGFFAFGDI